MSYQAALQIQVDTQGIPTATQRLLLLEKQGQRTALATDHLKASAHTLERQEKQTTVATHQLQNSVHQLERQEKQAGLATHRVSDSFQRLIPLATALVATLGITEIITVTRQYERLQARLVTVTGSVQEASDAFAALQAFSKQTPYDIEQITAAFVQLNHLGLDPSREALTAYGNTAAALGKQLSQWVEAIADAVTGEFERLKEFGILARRQSDQIAFTFSNATTTVKNNATEIESYLKKLGTSLFTGAMSDRIDTLDTDLTRLKSSWDELWLAITGPKIKPAFRGLVQNITESIDSLSESIRAGSLLEEALGKRLSGVLSSALDTGLLETAIEAKMSHFEAFLHYLRKRFSIHSRDFFDYFQQGLDGSQFDSAPALKALDHQYAAQKEKIEQQKTLAREKQKTLALEKKRQTEQEHSRQQQQLDYLDNVKAPKRASHTDERALENVRTSLQTEEEAIEASFERRQQIILANTTAGSQQQQALILRLTEQTQQKKQALMLRLEQDTHHTLLEENRSFWEQYADTAKDRLTDLDTVASSTLDHLTHRIGAAFEAMVFDSNTAGEAFQHLAEGLARSMVGALGKMAAEWLVYQTIQRSVGRQAATASAVTMTAQAQAAAAMAGIHAYSSTAAIPIVGPEAAPAAMASALAATQPLAAGVAALESASVAGAYDQGGMIPAGKVGLVGEKGPEWIAGPAVITSRRSTQPKPVKNRVSIVINNYSSAQVTTQETTTDEGGSVVTVLIEKARALLTQDIQRGGNPVSRALEQTYRLRRGQ